MKKAKTNQALMKALAHVQAAASVMAEAEDEVQQDALIGVSSADDEPDFQELHNIAQDLYGKLCRMVPRFRLLIYTGAPKGTVYKKPPPPQEIQTVALVVEINKRLMLDAADREKELAALETTIKKLIKSNGDLTDEVLFLRGKTNK